MLEPRLAGRVADAFGLGAGATFVGPVATGRLGRIWRLETDRGAWAVKDSEHPLDPGEVERDAAYQDLVRAAGVPMPAVVRTREGAVLADVEGPVRAYTWVDLLPRERLLDPALVGRTLAHVHSVVVPAADPVDGWYVDPLGAEAWADLVDRLRRAGAPFAGRLEALLPDQLALEERLEAPTDVQLCHRDLWADNVLRSPAGGLVVLDWENSGPGSPSHELGVAMFEFGLGDPARMRALHAAYVEAGGPGRLTDVGDLTMLVAQSAHIVRVGCERWMSARSDAGRADNEAWVAEFLDDPVTPEVVATILSASRT